MSLSNSAPLKTPEDTFSRFKSVIKMQLSENRGIRGRFSSTAQQRLDESGYAAGSQNTALGLSSVKNFSSIREQQEDRKQTCTPK